MRFSLNSARMTNVKFIFKLYITKTIFFMFYILLFVLFILLLIVFLDVNQKNHTLKRNFPLLGRLRYLAESLGPPIRQYFIANNREELPFNRSQRTWIYASSKGQNNYEGFGTDKDIYSAKSFCKVHRMIDLSESLIKKHIVVII